MYFLLEAKIGANVNVYPGMAWLNLVLLLKPITKKELVALKHVYQSWGNSMGVVAERGIVKEYGILCWVNWYIDY